MSKSKSSKLRPYQKTWLRRLAADRLGMSSNAGKNKIAAAAAKRLGIEDQLQEKGCYAILIAFVGEVPQSRPRLIVPRAKYAPKPKIDPASDEFLQSYEWRQLRMRVLVKYGSKCQCCGCDPSDGVKIHVDHIKPRKKYPELALVESNLQILCEVCNHGKGNWDETDWRKQCDQFTPIWSRRTH
jgi:hypothetical protein